MKSCQDTAHNKGWKPYEAVVCCAVTTRWQCVCDIWTSKCPYWRRAQPRFYTCDSVLVDFVFLFSQYDWVYAECAAYWMQTFVVVGIFTWPCCLMYMLLDRQRGAWKSSFADQMQRGHLHQKYTFTATVCETETFAKKTFLVCVIMFCSILPFASSSDSAGVLYWLSGSGHAASPHVHCCVWRRKRVFLCCISVLSLLLSSTILKWLKSL